MSGAFSRIVAASRIRPSIDAATKASASRSGVVAWASTAALSCGQLAKPSSLAMTSWAAARVTTPSGALGVVAGEALYGVGIAAAGGVAQLLGLAAQLVEIGALGKQSGHGVSL